MKKHQKMATKTKAPKATPAPKPSTPEDYAKSTKVTFVEPGGNEKRIDDKLNPEVGHPVDHPKEPVVTNPTLEQEEAMIPQENLRMPDGSKPITAKDFEIARGVDKHE